MNPPGPADSRVPGFLGQVLDRSGHPAGMCFQVAPGVLVTAWHVVESVSGAADAEVRIDSLREGRQTTGLVVRLDPVHDLAVIRIEDPFSACVAGLSSTDRVPANTPVLVTGSDDVAGVPRPSQLLSSSGAWQGPGTKDDTVPLSRIAASGVMPGMSGTPVRRLSDDYVVGLISGRYNSADGWPQGSVWVARTENLCRLLESVAPVELSDPLVLDSAADLVLTVDATQVRLSGAAISVAAPHGGVTPGLLDALYEVQRSRRNAASVTSDLAAGTTAAAAPLTRVGHLLAASFMPDAVAAAFRQVMQEAAGRQLPVRVGIEASGLLTDLPWESLPNPLDGCPLALHPQIDVYRKVAGSKVVKLGGPLRILVAISAPEHSGGGVLDYERELRSVLAAVRSARQDRAQVRIVQFGTATAIRAGLTAESVHVLHLSGHGRPGAIELEDEDGGVRVVSAEQFLAEAIPPGRMPPVISLAACDTGVAAAEPGSFAAQLVRHGAGAVVATETSITDRYATRVFARLYANLAESDHPDAVAAVAEARRSVHRELSGSADARDQQLAQLNEWSVLSVWSRDPTAVFLDSGMPAHTARGHAVPSSAPYLGDLPSRPVGDFVGRRREQRTWPGELIGARTAGLVLHGIGGIGKTTLAAQIVGRVGQVEPSWLVCSLTGEISVDGVLGALARTLGRHMLASIATGDPARAIELAERWDKPWIERVGSLREHVLDHLPVLLILDNFEDNLSADSGRWEVKDPAIAEMLSALVRDPGRLRLLITSRYPFGLPESAEHGLSFHQLGPLSLAETLKLVWSLPALDRLGDRQIEQAWRLVGGHPRALEYLDALLSGGQARYEDVTERLTQAIEAKLGEAGPAAWTASEAFDKAVAATVTLSADEVLLDDLVTRISPAAQLLLIGVSVYREPFDYDAMRFQLDETDYVAAPADDPGGPRQTERQILKTAAETSACAATSLLTLSLDKGTFFVHRWTAAELQRHLTSQGRGEELIKAHLRACKYWRWRATSRAQDLTTWVHDLLEARYHLLEAEQIERAAALTEQIVYKLDDAGALDHEASLIHETLNQLSADSPRRVAWIGQLGDVAMKRGQYERAEALSLESLKISERLGRHDQMAMCYDHLGLIAQFRGEFDLAEARYLKAQEIKKLANDQRGVAKSYTLLGRIAEIRQDYERAQACYRQAREIDQRLSNQAESEIADLDLGMFAMAQGNYEQAEAHFQRALRIQAQSEDWEGYTVSLHSLGFVAQMGRDYEVAGAYYRRALAISKKLGRRASTAKSFASLGVLAQLQGQDDRAEAYYRRALEIHEELSDRVGVASMLFSLGMIAALRGDDDQAEIRCRQAIKIFEGIGPHVAIANSYQLLGDIAKRRGEVNQTNIYYRQAQEISKKLGDETDFGMLTSLTGNIAADRGATELAIDRHVQAILLRVKLGVAKVNLNIAENSYDLRRLSELRATVGENQFISILTTLVDAEILRKLVSAVSNLENEQNM
jgi:tetratricopeptide (TPR) repeat protein/S1-C subfamily serine protease